MIAALLTFVFLSGLLYGRVPLPLLLAGSAACAVFIYLNSRHQHGRHISIDILAQASRLKEVNAALKVVTLLTLMLLSVMSRNAYTGLVLAAVLALAAICLGGMKAHEYLGIFALPLSFLMAGGLALLVELRPEADLSAALSVAAFGRLYLTVSVDAQLRCALVVSRALGALSCLLLLGMTTPMPELIAGLRRARCPELVIDLGYLVYRYIFILLALVGEMEDAARSRLGYRDYRSSLRTVGGIYSQLLARSHRQASRHFDAMESRCFDSGIRFIERRRPVAVWQAAACLLLVAAVASLAFIPITG